MTMIGGADSVVRVRQTISGAAELRPPLFRRITVRQYRWLDVGLAAFFLVVTAPGVINHHPGGSLTKMLLVLCLLGANVPIAFRRRAPVPALAVIAASVAVGFAFGAVSLTTVNTAIPMFQVAARIERRTSLRWLVVVLVAFTVATCVAAANSRPHEIGAGFAIAIAAWFVGDSTRVRRAYTAGLAEQTAQRSREELERAQRSVAEEKIRIARDLHDVIAHTLSVVAVQSGMGRHVIDAQPNDAKHALEAIEETSREALGELRRMLNVLRSDETTVDLAPAPGIRDIAQVAEHVIGAGIPVVLTFDLQDLSDIPASVDLSVFRIVQEALTNVVKHAGPASATVDIRHEGGALLVTVQDDGIGDRRLETAFAEGHGIIGMRERAATLDGVLIAESLPGRGFCVRARLPLHDLS